MVIINYIIIFILGSTIGSFISLLMAASGKINKERECYQEGYQDGYDAGKTESECR
jgi:hypothetical protein